MDRSTLVIVGNGMVGQRLCDELHERNAGESWQTVVLGDENRPAYDRVHLTAVLEGSSPDELSLVSAATEADPSIEVCLGESVVCIDRAARTVDTSGGRTIAYDALVLATGAYAFVPPVTGADMDGCYVYRTLDDVAAIAERSRTATSGIVVGGGLLGLEAANALRALGVEATVVEFAPHLMAQQLDELSGSVLGAHVAERGIGMATGCGLAEILGGTDGVEAVVLSDGRRLAADIVVFAAGVRARDELAREAGIAVGERGGVIIDEACATDDPAVFAIGDCVSFGGQPCGLVAPGYTMAAVVADRLMGGDASFTGIDTATRLKLLGVDVAVFGDVRTAPEGARVATWHDPVRQVAKRVIIDPLGERVLAASFVGDATGYLDLLGASRGGGMADLPGGLDAVLFVGVATTDATGPSNATLVCSCNSVTRGQICEAVASGCESVGDVKSATRAGSTCGSCLPLVKQIVDEERARQGAVVDTSLCEHFEYTRQELADLVRVHRIATFAELREGWGRGVGCEICKPAVASILAAFWNDHILDGAHLELQDSNDRYLANIQRDGTYSVIPRMPGGEVTADKLMVVAEVARDFDLYVKLTGGQRIDLLGARIDQLPAIWERLVEAGFESGHAYGKALRTVKSCVGTTWCRFGVQDSTSLAVELELRYRGLRSPHKLKSAVSGCARECAEARSKDFGVIATERGWNLYVGGNGGMQPRHAELLAEGVDTATLIKYIDRFVMYYIRTADRLERTSTWMARLDGGVEHVRSVVVDDRLGIAAELEAELQRSLDNYECEWAAVLKDPAKLARFSHFVNVDQPDPSLAFERERGQRIPLAARPEMPREANVTIRSGNSFAALNSGGMS